MLDFLGYALLAALLLLFLAYLMRTTSIRRLRPIRDGEPPIDARSPKFNMYLELLTSAKMVGGNEIELLFNGDETYPRLWETLAQASETICIHVYVFKPGQIADRLLQVLSERAQAGVTVLVLLDAWGASLLPKNYRERLVSAGAQVAVYRPPRIKEIYKFQQRMHMRAIVIDGRIGFTGGFGLADEWLGNGRGPDQWRDTSARIAGPVAMQLQVAFSNNWAEATGDLLVGDAITPFTEASPPSEPQAAGIMACSPSLGSTNAERFFFLAITSARQRVYIASAYFAPTRDMRWLLMNAADRGVEVRILTPGRNTDFPVVWHAGRSVYPKLLEAGVRIYEYQPGMMHAKTLVADSCWASVGTFNLDNRSMKLNDEVALVIRDEDIAQHLERQFLADLEYAREIQLEDLATVSWPDWALTRFARLAIPVL